MKIDINSPIIKHLISYPKFDYFIYQERLKQLSDLGIKEILLYGPTKINNLDILGKGHSGLVVRVSTNKGNNFALKIRRVDSPRENLYEESKIMQTTNLLNIGPKLIYEKRDFIP